MDFSDNFRDFLGYFGIVEVPFDEWPIGCKILWDSLESFLDLSDLIFVASTLNQNGTVVENKPLSKQQDT